MTITTDVSQDAVLIELAANPSPQLLAEIVDYRDAEIRSVVHQLSDSSLVYEPMSDACETVPFASGQNRLICRSDVVRGGVGFYAQKFDPNTNELENISCAIGFSALYYSEPAWVTAGHCLDYAEFNRVDWPPPANSGGAHSYIMKKGADGRADLGQSLGESSYWEDVINRHNGPDAGLIHGEEGSKLTPYPWILVLEGDDDTQRNERYPVQKVDTPDLHAVVCMTGARTTKTDCGEVNHRGASQGTRADVQDICADHGDSGGPVYKNHVAYGILAATRRGGILNATCWTQSTGALTAEDKLDVTIATVDRWDRWRHPVGNEADCGQFTCPNP